jgi:hypothetical protein
MKYIAKEVAMKRNRTKMVISSIVYTILEIISVIGILAGCLYLTSKYLTGKTTEVVITSVVLLGDVSVTALAVTEIAQLLELKRSKSK